MRATGASWGALPGEAREEIDTGCSVRAADASWGGLPGEAREEIDTGFFGWTGKS